MNALGHAATVKQVSGADKHERERELTELAISAADGDDLAWRRLWAAVEPRLTKLASRPRFLGRLALIDDDCQNVVLSVMDRLHADDRRRLKVFAEAAETDPSRQFWPWLVVVAKRVGIDYMRSHEKYIGRRGKPSASRPAWAHDTTATDEKLGGHRPPMTNRGTARELLDIAANRLSAPQLAAIESWLRGCDYATIAADLALPDRRDAERLVRSGLERLRRAVRDGGRSS